MKLLITSKIPEKILKILKENFEITYHDSLVPLNHDELLSKSKDTELILCPLSDKIDSEIINSAQNLKMIANYGAGYDNIDVKAASEKNIVVTNAPAPSSATSTAELTFALILATARNIVSGDKLTRAKEFLGWRPTFYLGHQLKGKTLGIIGLGNIGKNLAKMAKAFGMDVIYYSRTRKEDFEKEVGITFKNRDEVIKNSDFLSLHTAFTPELKHLISEKEFKMMKNTAILINASRGPIVDEKALAKALKDGDIAAAGLDVYEKEPEVLEELLEMDNVVLLPHLGNATFDARMEMGENALDNLLSFKKGKAPKNKIN